MNDESPKQRMRRADARYMASLVSEGHQRSARERLIEQVRAEQRAEIVAWLRREADQSGDVTPVDRWEMARAVATWIETEAWRRPSASQEKKT